MVVVVVVVVGDRERLHRTQSREHGGESKE